MPLKMTQFIPRSTQQLTTVCSSSSRAQIQQALHTVHIYKYAGKYYMRHKTASSRGTISKVSSDLSMCTYTFIHSHILSLFHTHTHTHTILVHKHARMHMHTHTQTNAELRGRCGDKHTSNLSTQEADVGGWLRVQDQLALHSSSLAWTAYEHPVSKQKSKRLGVNPMVEHLPGVTQ